MSVMATTDRSWRNGAALLAMGAIVALALFLGLRPLRVETPASEGAQAMLRLDDALGATVEPLDHTTASVLGLRSAGRYLVITSVANHGPAASAGLRVGDVIERIGGHPAGDEVRNGGRLTPAERLAIRRDGKTALVDVQLGDSSRG